MYVKASALLVTKVCREGRGSMGCALLPLLLSEIEVCAAHAFPACSQVGDPLHKMCYLV